MSFKRNEMQPSMQDCLPALKLGLGNQTSPVSIISFGTMAFEYQVRGQCRIVAELDALLPASLQSSLGFDSTGDRAFKGDL